MPPEWCIPPGQKEPTHVEFISESQQYVLPAGCQSHVTLWVRMSLCFQPSLWIRCKPPVDVPNASHFLDTAKQVHCNTKDWHLETIFFIFLLNPYTSSIEDTGGEIYEFSKVSRYLGILKKATVLLTLLLSVIVWRFLYLLNKWNVVEESNIKWSNTVT